MITAKLLASVSMQEDLTVPYSQSLAYRMYEQGTEVVMHNSFADRVESLPSYFEVLSVDAEVIEVEEAPEEQEVAEVKGEADAKQGTKSRARK